MLPRSNDLLHASVVISELPARRTMPAPTPLPTLQQPGVFTRWMRAWLQPQEATPAVRRSAQVLVLRA
ncbi:hypothetical protein FSC37_00135 [Piscinibacter aquaticus]|uniref:Uncharacterized protein n=1 Tax=Piscinibacter aquaticus TaxID=392597 RepID=A0A5C6TXE4_9BURK|nr:hypothetical protein FSC37_00135 [Piscinibacter aquaticus]